MPRSTIWKLENKHLHLVAGMCVSGQHPTACHRVHPTSCVHSSVRVEMTRRRVRPTTWSEFNGYSPSGYSYQGEGLNVSLPLYDTSRVVSQ